MHEPKATVDRVGAFSDGVIAVISAIIWVNHASSCKCDVTRIMPVDRLLFVVNNPSAARQVVTHLRKDTP
jgi:hypothetical protein